MSDTIIHVENLSKKYLIGKKRDKSDGLRHVIHDITTAPFRKLFGKNGQHEINSKPSDEEFWALKDVSFEVKQGEVVGIIGRNGAGKSTLLKILSRITEPTSGKIRIKGRVASLLEVGTGFHQELTGRENIFLNGAILGMSKVEIKRKFDEIVAFSGIEKFLDTPVKRYSSGMYVRLAFAVAAHLEPEILIIDEVLAVGDAEFQKKCLGKMQDVSQRQGRTVLFVSHNMNAVESLCNRIAHFGQGKLLTITDDLRSVITAYLPPSVISCGIEWQNSDNEYSNPWFQPSRFYLGDEKGNVAKMPVRNDQPVYVWIEGKVEKEEIALNIGYALYDESGSLLYWSAHTDLHEDSWPRLTFGRNILKSQIPQRFLNQGKYRIELLIALYQREWMSEPGANAPAIELVIQGGLSDSPYWMERRPGVLAPVCDWTSEKKDKVIQNGQNRENAH